MRMDSVVPYKDPAKRRTWQKAYSQAHREASAKWQREVRDPQRKINTAFIQAIKLAKGCVDCGYRDHAEALEFDHLPGYVKRMNVSEMTRFSRKTIEAEIAKCEVVCANCHRVRTALRRELASSGD